MPQDLDPDVFVSYAWRDNLAPRVRGADEKRDRWVWMFAETLESALGMKLGRDACVWVDREGISISDKPVAVLSETLGKSPLLLALISPSWLASRFCPEELKEFRRTHPGTTTREDVLVALIEHVERDDWTSHVDVNGMPFYRELRPGTYQRLGYPVPSLEREDHREFFDEINVLAGEISARLRQLQRSRAARAASPVTPDVTPAAPVPPPDPAQPLRPLLWLADSPASLAGERRDLTEAVRQAGFDVVAPAVLDQPLMPMEAALGGLRSSLQPASVLVQLLDHEPVRGAPDGRSWAQVMADEARAASQRLQAPFVQWRRPGSLGKAPEGAQRDLLLGAIEPTMEELRTSVLALLRAARTRGATECAGGVSPSLLCMAYAEDDTDTAHEVGRMLDELKVDYEPCVTPAQLAQPGLADQQGDSEDLLMRQAAGVIIIHGKAAQEWLNTTVVRLKQLRGRRGRWGALIDRQPVDRPLPPPQSMIQRLDWRTQPRFELLQQFVESLEVAPHA
jgi:hypothetical protein